MQTELLRAIGFMPKENASKIYQKHYKGIHDYVIEVDFNQSRIDYGNLIQAESQTTQNFSQAENWVVLECVDRLLEKGYPPQNIILEKTWSAGHGVSKRLDICVVRDVQGVSWQCRACLNYHCCHSPHFVVCLVCSLRNTDFTPKYSSLIISYVCSCPIHKAVSWIQG